jgi:hypothetical protein
MENQIMNVQPRNGLPSPPQPGKTMLQTVEALLNTDGALRFLEPVHFSGSQRVLVTFTQPLEEALSGAVLSEHSLATDWLRDEEDAAWAHLQPAPAASAKAGR